MTFHRGRALFDLAVVTENDSPHAQAIHALLGRLRLAQRIPGVRRLLRASRRDLGPEVALHFLRADLVGIDAFLGWGSRVLLRVDHLYLGGPQSKWSHRVLHKRDLRHFALAGGQDLTDSRPPLAGLLALVWRGLWTSRAGRRSRNARAVDLVSGDPRPRRIEQLSYRNVGRA